MPEAAKETGGWPGTPEGVSGAIDAFGRFCRANGLSDTVRRPFQLALDEVLSNIVRHGLAGRVGRVQVVFESTGTLVSVEVIDDARAFNPLSAPPPDTTSALERRAPGGLGIALVSSLMDDVRYERRDGQNHLFMMRRMRDDD